MAIALDAYARHKLQGSLSAHDLESLATAIHYQQWHALLLVMFGLIEKNSLFIRLSSLFIVAGIALFCFGIYLSVLAQMPGALAGVPLGGVSFIAGWLFLSLSALEKHHADN